MNSVHKSQVLLDTASDFRASHIGDIINPQHEQDQSDQAEIGLEKMTIFQLETQKASQT